MASSLPGLRRALLALAAFALLATQGYGLQHRIEHRRAATWSDATAGAAGVAEHACSAIDALALSGAPPRAATGLPPPAPAAKAAPAAPSGRDRADPPDAFQARAPPATA